jgi:imidazolonepropionase-like amidohydrolase
MRRLIGAFLFLVAGMSVVSGQNLPDFAFVDVDVVRPAVGTIDRHQTVLVSNGLIKQIGAASSITVPDNFTVIAKGGFLLPGLTEMHAHVPFQVDGEQYLKDILFLWLANGVTTIRGMRGEPAHLELRGKIERREWAGPRLYTAGPPFIGGSVTSPEQARLMAIEQAEAGYDFFKVHMGLGRSEYDAVAEQGAVFGIPFAGHVSEAVGLSRALQAGQSTIDHLDSYIPALVDELPAGDEMDYGLMGAPLTPFVDPDKIPVVARMTAAAGVWNVPTLSMVENFVRPVDAVTSRSDLRYMPPRTVRGWIGAARGFQKSSIRDPVMAERFLDYRKQLVLALHKAGAGLLLGSDAPQILNVPGFSLHEELRLLTEAGLTPAEALTTGTANPARFFGESDRFGRIVTGLEADLILADGNPLADLETLRLPRGVMYRGTWLARSDIRAGLADIADRNQGGTD